LAYSIVDAVVDAYFPAVDEFAERLEQLDQEITAGHAKNLMGELHSIRANLMALRRLIQPLRDSLVGLMPDPHSLISSETQFYFRDCFDHTIQLIELLDTYRETCASLRDYYMTAINYRMNEVMKTLTIVATIFIPLSFITGMYGMNFNTRFPTNMPELNWPYGYLSVLVLMALVAIGQVMFIRHKGWLSG
jgi:magnesium transporter